MEEGQQVMMDEGGEQRVLVTYQQPEQLVFQHQEDQIDHVVVPGAAVTLPQQGLHAVNLLLKRNRLVLQYWLNFTFS